MKMSGMRSGYTLVLCGFLTGVAGCATSTYQRADRAAASMADTRQMLAEGRRQISVTVGALDRLASLTDQDLSQQFRGFSDQVLGTERMANRVGQQANSMRNRSESYFAAWEREMEGFNNPEIRQLSEDRRAETMAQYDKLTQSMDDVRESFVPFLEDLKDIQRHLSADLSKAGITSAEGLVLEAKRTAQAIQQKIGISLSELDRVSALLSSTQP